jgi:hypothetical protein
LASTVVEGTLLPSIASAEVNQVFFRGGAALAASNRAREGFTDIWSVIRLLRGLVWNKLFAAHRIAMQDRAIADEFLKTLRTVPDEIKFDEASQFDL